MAFSCIRKQSTLNVHWHFLASQNKIHPMYIRFTCITKQNTSNVHMILLALQNNTQPMYIPFLCITKYTLKLPGFHPMVKQNTPEDISFIYNLTIRIRIMKTKHAQSSYRITESDGATTTPPYFISFEVMM